MRKHYPNESRPFRIPLGVPGLWLMMLLPYSVYGVALATTIYSLSSEGGSAWYPIALAIGALAFADVIWRIIVARQPAVTRRSNSSS